MVIQRRSQTFSGNVVKALLVNCELFRTCLIRESGRQLLSLDCAASILSCAERRLKNLRRGYGTSRRVHSQRRTARRRAR
jgi:hypothetical protein